MTDNQVASLQYELMTAYKSEITQLRQTIGPLNDLVQYQRSHINGLEQINKSQAEKITALEAVVKQLSMPIGSNTPIEGQPLGLVSTNPILVPAPEPCEIQRALDQVELESASLI